LTGFNSILRSTLASIALAASLVAASVPAEARSGAGATGSKTERASRGVIVSVSAPEFQASGSAPATVTLMLGVGC